MFMTKPRAKADHWSGRRHEQNFGSRLFSDGVDSATMSEIELAIQIADIRRGECSSIRVLVSIPLHST